MASVSYIGPPVTGYGFMEGEPYPNSEKPVPAPDPVIDPFGLDDIFEGIGSWARLNPYLTAGIVLGMGYILFGNKRRLF